MSMAGAGGRAGLASDALSSLGMGVVVSLLPGLFLLGIVGLAYKALAPGFGPGVAPAQAFLIAGWLATFAVSTAVAFRSLRMEAHDVRGVAPISFQAPLGLRRDRRDEPAGRKAADVCECLARNLPAKVAGAGTGRFSKDEAAARFLARRGGARVLVVLSVLTDDLRPDSSQFVLTVVPLAPSWLRRPFEFAPALVLRADVEDALECLLRERGFDPRR